MLAVTIKPQISVAYHDSLFLYVKSKLGVLRCQDMCGGKEQVNAASALCRYSGAQADGDSAIFSEGFLWLP